LHIFYIFYNFVLLSKNIINVLKTK